MFGPARKKLTCSKPLEPVKIQLTLKAMELRLFKVPTKTGAQESMSYA
jgi:hypothetical protein